VGGHSCTHNITTLDYSGGKVSILGGDNIGHFEEEVRMNVCLILNGYQDKAIHWPPRSPDLTPLDLSLWVWKKSEVFKTKVDTPDELLARILDAASSMKKCEDQLRRSTRDLRTRVAKCLETDGDFRKFIVDCIKFVIFVLEIYHSNIKIQRVKTVINDNYY